MLPVEPATITGSGGGALRHASAWASISRRRRSAGPMQPSSRSTAGQWAVTISRKRRVVCQCAAKTSGTRSASWSNERPSVSTWSIKAARAAASWTAWSSLGTSWAPSAARRADQARISRASSSWRRSAGMAGGRSAAAPVTPSASSPKNSSSSASRSPRGRMRGSRRGRPRLTRRKASLRARTARRVGSSTVVRESASGSPAVSSRRPSARVSAKQRPAGIVEMLAGEALTCEPRRG